MKFPLYILLASTAAAPLSFSSASATQQNVLFLHHRHCRQPSLHIRRNPTCLYYKEPSRKSDPDNDDPNDNVNVWSVLANTERWISETLDRSNKSANDANRRRDAEEKLKQRQSEENKKKMHFADEKEESSETDNPYARKEVSYVCETGNELAVVVGGVFRRVREARELGENHGRGVEARLMGEF